MSLVASPPEGLPRLPARRPTHLVQKGPIGPLEVNHEWADIMITLGSGLLPECDTWASWDDIHPNARGAQALWQAGWDRDRTRPFEPTCTIVLN